MYIIRDGLIEFSGNKRDVVAYIKSSYCDEYWVMEYGNRFEKDWELFKYCLENMGLYISQTKPKKRR